MKKLVLSAEDAEIVRGALDLLAGLVPLAHEWSDGERALYEEACSLLGLRPDEFAGVFIVADVECLECHHVWRGRFDTTESDPAKLECAKCGAQNSRVIEYPDASDDDEAWKDSE